MELTKYERETIVNYNEEDSQAEVYTASKPVMRKLDKLCEHHPDTYKCVKRNSQQATYTCPKNRIRFAAPTSEKQKAASRAKALQYGFKNGQLADTESAEHEERPNASPTKVER